MLAVAVIASMIFNAVALSVWKMNFGSTPATLNGWRIAEPGPQAPSAAQGAIAPDGDDDEPRNPFNFRLRVHAAQLEPAQHFVIPFLEARVKRWQIAEILSLDDGTTVIEIDLKLKKSMDREAFIDAIEHGDPHVLGVELSKLDSRKHRLP
jgi:hypothetical protein